LPLSDRDYMRTSPPPARRTRNFGGFTLSPIWVLIIINFLLFIITIIWGRGILNVDGVGYPVYKTHYYLGLIPAIFWERLWTILTSIFVHSDFMHILFNMIALFFFGRTLAILVGVNRFLLVYFIGGIAGNVLYLFLNMSSTFPLVGASGAVYAIAGVLVVMVPNMRVALWGIIPMPLWVFVIVFLLLLSLPPFVAVNVAWQAHLGGLAVGLIAGYFFRRKMRYIIYR